MSIPEEKNYSANIKIKLLNNVIYESIATYVSDNTVIADFLGIICEHDDCQGIVYSPSRAYDFFVKKEKREIMGHLIFTNNPEDLFNFFLEKERVLKQNDDCYVMKNSFLTIKYNGEVTKLDEGKFLVKVKLREACDVKIENFSPPNRFTNLLIELLINITKQRYYCLTNENNLRKKLTEINNYLLEILKRHSSRNELLRSIAEKVEELSLKSSMCL